MEQAVVKIIAMAKHHEAFVSMLCVADEQVQFVSPVGEILETAFKNKDVTLYVILANNEVIGCFLIDKNFTLNDSFCEPSSLGLGKFLIDRHHQGKGFATNALKYMKTYLKSQYPGYRNVYLTVNCRNKIAYKCYLKGGFTDDGDLYFGGTNGPQHVMKLDIS